MSIYRGRDKKEFYLASLLYDAIDDLNYSAVYTLLSVNRADPNLVLPKHGIAPFHLVIGSDSNEFALKCTNLILQFGGNPNLRSDEGLTPLHIAAAWGRLDIVQLLLNCGADPTLRDSTDMTAIKYAFEEDYLECFHLLLSYVDHEDNVWTRLNRSVEDERQKYDVKLEKVVIDTAIKTNTYQVVVKESTNNPNRSQQLSPPVKKLLDVTEHLPPTNHSEYVNEWVENSNAQNHLVESPSLTSSTLSLKISGENYGSISSFLSIDNNRNPQGIPWKNDEKSQLYGDLNLGAYKRKDSLESGIQTTERSVMEDEESSLVDSFEQNIFQIEDDSNSSESEGVDTKDTARVSEVYRYVDNETGVAFYETRLVQTHISLNSTEGSSSCSLPSTYSTVPEAHYDTDRLRIDLETLGFQSGPITASTKKVYLKKLKTLKKHQNEEQKSSKNEPIEVNLDKDYSPELTASINSSTWLADHLDKCQRLEACLLQQFANPDYSRNWRGGHTKSCFTYLLLDPGIYINETNNNNDNLFPTTPTTPEHLYALWRQFLAAIFYVGKGKRNRPYDHLMEAAIRWRHPSTSNQSTKISRILEIWAVGDGVICLHVFQNTVAAEAHTREAAMIDALRLRNICNLKGGEYYGVAATWTCKERSLWGVYLLYRAMRILHNEGVRQLRPFDIE